MNKKEKEAQVRGIEFSFNMADAFIVDGVATNDFYIPSADEESDCMIEFTVYMSDCRVHNFEIDREMLENAKVDGEGEVTIQYLDVKRPITIIPLGKNKY